MIFLQHNDYGRRPAFSKIRYWIILMKLTIFLTVLSVFKLTASGFAQHISLKAIDVPLIEIMQSIQKQSGIPFLLNGKDLARTKVTVDLKNVPLEKGLITIFRERPITWEISDGTIILRNSKTKSNPSSSMIAQQEQVVTGRITDEQGMPIQGASVQVKDTSEGTITDEQGNFSVTVTTNSILRVSSVGFLPTEVIIDNQEAIRITLKASFGHLDEVVAVGYGTQPQKLTTGASVHVKGDDLQKLSTPSILEALQSQSPGVQITQSSGMPGESFKVNINRKSTRLNSSHVKISYAVFCLKKKKINKIKDEINS